MFNELIFFGYIFAVSTFTLIALKISKEALISLICVQYILVNLFVTKEISLFGFTATASDAIAVGIALALNLLQEYYQKATAQKTIWISFFCAIYYIIISQFHLAYMPGPTDISSAHFQILLSPMARIICASLFVYLLVAHIESYLYHYLSHKFENRFFIIRNYSSVAITQFIDTVLFSFLGLYGINESFNSVNTILQIIAISYAIKLVVILVAAPFLSLSKKFVTI